MEKKKYKIIIGILVLISIFFRIIVIEKTPVNDTTQIDAEMGIPKTIEDYEQLYNLENYDLTDVGHFYYIMHLYTTHSFSDDSLGQTYHPPIHYILSAIWLSFLDNFQLNSMQKIEGLQYLGLIYFIISVVLLYKLLDKVKLSNISKILIILLYCFYPKFVIITTYITNDFLLYIFELLVLIWLMKWNENANFKNAIILAIITALGFLVKFNCLVMLVPIGICYIQKFINNIKSKKDNAFLILQGIVFWNIVLFLGGLYIFRRLIVTGQYYIAIPIEDLYIGDASFLETWGIKLKELLCLTIVNTKNVWSGFIYTSLIGNSFKFIKIIGILNFILMLMSFVGIYKSLKTEEKNLKIILITWFANLLAFVVYNIKNPYSCTFESRYILIAITLGIAFLGKLYDKTNNKVIKNIEIIASLGFCIFSILSFIV